MYLRQATPCLQYGTDLDVDPSKGQDRRWQKPVAQLEFELAEHEDITDLNLGSTRLL